MKTKELINYLQSFDPESMIGWSMLNLDAGIKYNISGYELVKDEDINYPIILIETDGITSLEELRKEAEEL